MVYDPVDLELVFGLLFWIGMIGGIIAWIWDASTS